MCPYNNIIVLQDLNVSTAYVSSRQSQSDSADPSLKGFLVTYECSETVSKQVTEKLRSLGADINIKEIPEDDQCMSIGKVFIASIN